MDRPVGATIVAILIVLRGAFAIMVGLFGLGFGSLAFLSGTLTASAIGMDAGTLTIFWAVLRLIIGAFFLWLGYGLFKVAAWAWMWTVLLMVFTIIMDIIPAFTGGEVAWFGLAFSAIIIVYLLTNGVREAYLQ